MRHPKKPALPSRDHAGAKPLRYVNGRLYYVSGDMIDKIKRIPSQQTGRKKEEEKTA